jgi:hypothetical protein
MAIQEVIVNLSIKQCDFCGSTGVGESFEKLHNEVSEPKYKVGKATDEPMLFVIDGEYGNNPSWESIGQIVEVYRPTDTAWIKPIQSEEILVSKQGEVRITHGQGIIYEQRPHEYKYRIEAKNSLKLSSGYWIMPKVMGESELSTYFSSKDKAE